MASCLWGFKIGVVVSIGVVHGNDNGKRLLKAHAAHATISATLDLVCGIFARDVCLHAAAVIVIQ